MSRDYNKIYINGNSTSGSEKIVLGYMGNDTEIKLKPDIENVFHIPYFATEIKINDSKLVADGAIAGYFPAAADRIYENRKGYGDYSVNGPTPITDTLGDWRCAWLDKTDNKWKERRFDGATYTDVESDMTLTPGVQYKYLRFGERSAADLITSFAGPSGANLRLNVELWNEDLDLIDSSLSSARVEIGYNGPYTDILNVKFDSGKVPSYSLTFDNSYNIECYIPWKDKFDLPNEFTWSLWAHSPNWQECTSTQLVGNFTSETGIGVFVDTLSSYPFFVIPAISVIPSNPKSDIGHLLYINEDMDPYYDKQLTESSLSPANIAKPEFIALDSDNNVVVLSTEEKNPSIRKYDVKGKLLKTKSISDIIINEPITFEAEDAVYIANTYVVKLLNNWSDKKIFVGCTITGTTSVDNGTTIQDVPIILDGTTITAVNVNKESANVLELTLSSKPLNVKNDLAGGLYSAKITIFVKETVQNLFCANLNFPGTGTPKELTVDGKKMTLARSALKDQSVVYLDTTDIDFISNKTILPSKAVSGTGIQSSTTVSAADSTLGKITLNKPLTADIIINDMQLDVYVIVTSYARYYLKNNFEGYHYVIIPDKNELPTKEIFTTLDDSRTAFIIDPLTNIPELINVQNISVRYQTAVGYGTYTVTGIRDFKCIKNKKWVIGSDGNLYEGIIGQTYYELFVEFKDGATNFGIDPYNRLWVLHGTNKCSVYDSTYKPLNGTLFKFECGFDTDHVNKNISFICCYDRETDTRTWRCIIYYGDSGDSQVAPQVYSFTMEGRLYQTTDITSAFNPSIFKSASQTVDQFRFSCKGDFTGYERRRIFNTTEPYNNNPQLVLKTRLSIPSFVERPKEENLVPLWFEKRCIPINGWKSNSWQHFAVRLWSYDKADRTIQRLGLYINGVETPNCYIDITNQFEYNFESQPSFFIGTSNGSERGINRETKYISSIFNGTIEDFKIYDYPLPEKHLYLFINKAFPAEPMLWNAPIPNLQYTEQIERMFKHKIPGFKSSFFNIKINGSNITDDKTKQIVEQEIRNKLEEIKPMHTDLWKVEWND